MTDELTYEEALGLVVGYAEFCDRPENRRCVVIPPDNYSRAVAIVADRHVRLIGPLSGLLGYLGTAKQENTDEWMDQLAERMNQVYEAFGESDRVRYVGSNVGGWIEIERDKDGSVST